jgi:hypothetical protein
MSKEAMKLARELAHQIACGNYDGNAQYVLEKLDEALANHIPDDTKMVSGVKDSLTTQQEQGELAAIHQYRSPHCSDWYDGIPDHHDGHGPYEVRTLYTKPQPKQEQGEPVALQERKAVRMQDGVVTEWTNWYPCGYRTIDEARAEACDHIPYEWRPLYTTPQQRKPLTADDIKEPENGSEWRVEWWNESCRMMLPSNKRLDCFQSYKNGTLQFTIKEAAHGIKE